MRHLPFVPTPISSLSYYSKALGCNLLCKRDDLFMEACGGNKARMLQYILYKLTEEEYDVVITAGPKSSNFNRACALMCSRMGVPMHLVVYSSVEGNEKYSLNYKVCEWSNIAITRSLKNEVPQTIQRVISSYGDKKVLLVYGGGRSLEGVYAYYEAVEELHHQVDSLDHLFVACGTGTTLTGICAGMQEYFPGTQVHAISVSRQFADEKMILEEDMNWLNEYLGTNYNFSNLNYIEDYLCGGYGLYKDDILDSIRKAMSHESLVLDPCYSGKAWDGMISMIHNENGTFKGKNVLFWHTGGFFNLLSIL